MLACSFMGLMMRKWIRNVFVAIDQLVNALLLGDPDETISSRLAKVRGKYWLADLVCKGIDFVDPNHCAESIEEDEGKDGL